MTGFSFNLNEGFSDFAANTPADGCTMCGICLSVCPTFQQTQDHEQSPMGRIRMMRQLDQGEDISASMTKLESCLSCYACESKCPSRVDYGAMLDKALVEVRKQHKLPRISAMMLWLARHPLWLRVSLRLSALAQALGLRVLSRVSGLTRVMGLARADGMLESIPLPDTQLYNRTRTDQTARNVAMFTGCFSSVLEQELQQTSIDVLNALGFGVLLPKGQACCGALHRHNGESEQAAGLARKNLKAFNGQPATAILTSSSGCGAALKDYEQWLEGEQLQLPVMDISHFLAEHLKQRKLILQDLPLKVAVHTPCTLKQEAAQVEAMKALLQTIPGLQLHYLDDAPACCGAGGSQMLTHGEMADGLREPIIAQLAELKPDLLVSSNVGCALHLKAGLNQAGLEIPLQHPVQVLAQALMVEFVSSRPANAA